MVKLIYIWPDDVHFREWFTDKVHHFVQENNWTLDVSWDLLYQILGDERLNDYMKIEWDPKAIARSTFTKPGIRQANAPAVVSDTIIIETDTEVKTANIDDILNDQILSPTDPIAGEPATTEDNMTPVPWTIDELLNGEATPPDSGEVPSNTIVAETSSDVAAQDTLS